MTTVVNGYNFIEGDCAVAIGKFDGLHIGHDAIIKELVSLKKKGLTTVLLSFDPSPDVYFWRAEDTLLLTSSEMEERLNSYGIDCHLILSFTDELAKMTPEDFLNNILIEKLHVKEIVAGEDVSFGYKGRGNAEFLLSEQKKGRIKAHIIKKLTVDHTEVSSTLIRELIKNGKIEKANELLGYKYSFTGVAVEGKHLGRTYGFPTVNFYPEKKKVLPPNGVYFTVMKVKDKQYFAMTNIGVRPSVEEKKGINLETHLLAEAEELYGESCTVSLYAYHRPEEKFGSLEGLVEQLKKDRTDCRDFFGILK